MNTKDSKLWGNRLISVLGKTKVTKGLNVEKGGPGSGHFGHAGRPGLVGGSVESGVQVGRGEAPEAGGHFKWSGKAELRRKKGPGVNLFISTNKRKRRFEIHGAVDAKGNTRRGKAVIRTNGESIEVDHDELHDIRSKMRYVQMTNERDVRQIAGRDIVRGDSIDVEVGKKLVSIPVNQETVREIDRAAHAAKKQGFSFTGESKRQIRQAYEMMARGDTPIQVVKELGFSKAGKFAALRAYVDGPKRSKKHLADLIESKKGLVADSTMRALRRLGKDFHRTRSMAWKAREQRSGTDAAAHYLEAAAMWHKIERSGSRRRRK